MSLLTTTVLQREFIYKKGGKTIKLDDFNPMAEPKDILKFHANLYPELNNSSVGLPEMKDDKMIFNISTVVGTKG